MLWHLKKKDIYRNFTLTLRIHAFHEHLWFVRNYNVLVRTKMLSYSAEKYSYKRWNDKVH